MLPKIWKGDTVFLLGGGPSLTSVNLDLIKHRKIIAINNAYGYPVSGKNKRSTDGWLTNTGEYIPYDWVDIVWFGDGTWFNKHYQFLKNFKGIIAHCHPQLGIRNIAGLVYYQRDTEKQMGITLDPNKVVWNKNSGVSGINFAVHLGVKRIVLLGYDMKRNKEGTNWHNDHPSPPDKNPYWKYLRYTAKVKSDLDKANIDIVNCSEDSAIQDFKIMKLEDFLEWEKLQQTKKQKQ